MNEQSMTAPRDIRLFYAGGWHDGVTTSEVQDKFTGDSIGRWHAPAVEQIDAAVAALAASLDEPFEADLRAEVLRRASRLVAERRDDFLRTVAADTGFPQGDASTEVDRAIGTLRLCAEESLRLAGEMVPLDGHAGGAGRIGMTVHKPIGVVCAITPFNSPLNTVCHKVGPALAAGNSVILKPAPETPASAALLVQTLLDAGVPPQRLALLLGGGEVGERLLENADIDFYAFTGSTATGRRVAAGAGIRPTQLELGSIASTFVCSDADVPAAARAVCSAGFRKAGQVCTSVQRVYVDRSAADQFTEAMVAATSALRFGNPRHPDTAVGPLISLEAAQRVEGMVDEALDDGAHRMVGGARQGSVVPPTLLTDVDTRMRIMSEEVFGPVVCLMPYDDFDAALTEADRTPYGLSAGIFTTDLSRIMRAAGRLRVGALHVNRTSSNRVDAMPFGGVKGSGHGQEGPRYAVRAMTQQMFVSIGEA